MFIIAPTSKAKQSKQARKQATQSKAKLIETNQGKSNTKKKTVKANKSFEKKYG
jgi:hypothetical protein